MGLGYVNLLPVNRAYSEVEAGLSVAIDNFHNNKVTAEGYAKLWGWSRGKVARFLHKIGAEITYPEDTKNVRKQQGTLRKKTDKKRTINQQNMFIDIKWLQEMADIKRTKSDTLLKKSKRKIKKPTAKSDPKVTIFRDWFCSLFKEKFEREFIIAPNQYGKVGNHIKTLLSLDGLTFEDLQYITIEFIKDEDPFLTQAGHNFSTLLARVQQNRYSMFQKQDFREKYKRFIIREEGTPRYGKE
jgi:hypothetical protein